MGFSSLAGPARSLGESQTGLTSQLSSLSSDKISAPGGQVPWQAPAPQPRLMSEENDASSRVDLG